jgi:hypothetical protein
MNEIPNGLHSEYSTGTKGENRLKEILKDRWKKCESSLGDGAIIHNDKEYYYELKSTIKSFSENINLNQIRSIKCIPVIVYSHYDNKWVIITPDKIMKASMDKKRGQHSELFIECCQISSRKVIQNEECIDENELISQIEKTFDLIESSKIQKMINKSEEIRIRLIKFNEELKKEMAEVLNGS